MKVESQALIPPQETQNVEPVYYPTVNAAEDTKALFEDILQTPHSIEAVRTKGRRRYFVRSTPDSYMLANHRDSYQYGQLLQVVSLMTAGLSMVSFNIAAQLNELQNTLGVITQTEYFAGLSKVSNMTAMLLLALGSVGVVIGDRKVLDARVKIRRMGYDPNSRSVLKSKLIK